MAEASVAHRTIGQQTFGFLQREWSRSTLDEIAALIEWEPIATLLGRLYTATKGGLAWPPPMFRAMLLAVWYDLSDVKVADAHDDRASFRRFCGFSGTEATPERTAFVRFRQLLGAHDLDRVLFDAVTIQLTVKAITVKAGTIVDATIIVSASEDDGDGRWVKHRGKRATHGFKAHVACDADTALVERITAIAYNLKRTFNLLTAAARRNGGPIPSIEAAADESSDKNPLSQYLQPPVHRSHSASSGDQQIKMAACSRNH